MQSLIILYAIFCVKAMGNIVISPCLQTSFPMLDRTGSHFRVGCKSAKNGTADDVFPVKAYTGMSNFSSMDSEM